MTRGGKQTMTMVAYERIKSDILAMRFTPNQTLVEADLSELLEMSKTPIREALRYLSHDGLVELTEFRGTRVRDFTQADVNDIYQLRVLLEPEALRLAWPHVDADRVERLREVLASARSCAAVGDRVNLAAHNRAFHSQLIDRCSNRRLLRILEEVSDQVRLISLRGWTQQPSFFTEADEHASIVDALEHGDVEAAMTRLREHIVAFLDRIRLHG